MKGVKRAFEKFANISEALGNVCYVKLGMKQVAGMKRIMKQRE